MIYLFLILSYRIRYYWLKVSTEYLSISSVMVKNFPSIKCTDSCIQESGTNSALFIIKLFVTKS